MLYKYTSLAFAKSCVHDSYLWFSHIDHLNDPFECDLSSYSYDFPKYETAQDEYFRERRAMGGFGGRTPNHFFDYPVDEVGMPRRIFEEIERIDSKFVPLRDSRRTAFILSLASSHLSPAMWSHYGSRFAGACLALDEALLESSLASYQGKWKKLKVKYSNKKPEFNPNVDKHFENLISTKHPDWAYEKETRYILWPTQMDDTQTTGLRVPVSNRAIESVYIAFGFSNHPATELDELKAVASGLKYRIVSRDEGGWLSTAES